jgi:hypothetical protein
VNAEADLEVRVRRSVNEAEWNSFAKASTGNSLFQTTFFGDRLVELFGWDRLYFEVVDRPTDEVVGTLAAFEGRPGSGGSFVRGIANRVRRVRPRVHWHGQPVVLSGYDSPVVIRALLLRIGELCDELSLGGVDGSALADGVSIPRGWNATDWATYHIDVNRPEEEVWTSLSRTARKAVRRAEKQSISVRRVRDVDELEDHYSFATKVKAEVGQKLIGFRDFETMWRHIRGPGIFETFVAEIDGRAAAGISVWGHGDTITEIGAYVPRRSKEVGLNAGDALKWHIIRWACGQEFKLFDLAGFNPNPIDEKERLIDRFKAKWGGQRVDFKFVSRNG